MDGERIFKSGFLIKKQERRKVCGHDECGHDERVGMTKPLLTTRCGRRNGSFCAPQSSHTTRTIACVDDSCVDDSCSQLTRRNTLSLVQSSFARSTLSFPLPLKSKSTRSHSRSLRRTGTLSSRPCLLKSEMTGSVQSQLCGNACLSVKKRNHGDSKLSRPNRRGLWLSQPRSRRILATTPSLIRNLERGQAHFPALPASPSPPQHPPQEVTSALVVSARARRHGSRHRNTFQSPRRVHPASPHKWRMWHWADHLLVRTPRLQHLSAGDCRTRSPFQAIRRNRLS
jgi:hypothetical protein